MSFGGDVTVIWASLSNITFTIWVRVRVTGDAHIPRVLGMGMPKTRGCPYHCDGELAQYGKENVVRSRISISNSMISSDIWHKYDE